MENTKTENTKAEAVLVQLKVPKGDLERIKEATKVDIGTVALLSAARQWADLVLSERR